jgi:hypothetical protein
MMLGRIFGSTSTAHMSGIGGIIPGMNYSLLFSSNSAPSADAAGSILSALYSGASASAGPSTFSSTGNPLTDLKIAQADQTTDVAQEALQPQVSQAITAFKTAVASSTSIQSALLNPDVQKVLLTANGLSNYIGETALVQKVLLSDPTDSNSLVNQMGDSSLLSTVQTYNFAQNGLAELQNPTVISTLTNAYAEVQWRQSLDAATPGLANALSFLSSASSIKSFNDIIGNETNFEVITTALGIPENILNQDMTAQESAISSRLNYAQLQDPNYVTSLTDQYLLTMQESNQSSSSSSSGSSLNSLAVQAGGLMV